MHKIRAASATLAWAALAVALVGSHLSQEARRRALQALALARQKDDADVALRAAEAKSALVASLSHDLKTPLTRFEVRSPSLEDAYLKIVAATADEREETPADDEPRRRRGFRR